MPRAIAVKNRIYVTSELNNLYNLPADRSFNDFNMSAYNRGEYFRGSNYVQIISTDT
jgi:hypothetical protein